MTEVTQKAVPDLTQLRDPAALWPEPSDCPDWPYSVTGERSGDPPNRELAEARLANHIVALHGEDATLRAPTEAEIETAISRYFSPMEPGSRSGKSDRFEALGFAGLNKALSDNGGFALRIVESTHLRGWLRKLDAQAELGDAAQTERAERELKARVHRYTGVRDGHLSEINRLAEAEARHLQAKADKLAHARCVELRRALRISHADAEGAAKKLGTTVPELPEMRYDA